ncbi:MAG TPA: hypothetical protein PKC40_03590 [Saprospiraceae bacterium]|nr:hypothetical protein [Saprospiraceae bacterium]
MIDISNYLAALVEVVGGSWLGDAKEKAKFERDLKQFLLRQRQDTHLDIFKFAERHEVDQTKNSFRWKIYIYRSGWNR